MTQRDAGMLDAFYAAIPNRFCDTFTDRHGVERVGCRAAHTDPGLSDEDKEWLAGIRAAIAAMPRPVGEVLHREGMRMELETGKLHSFYTIPMILHCPQCSVRHIDEAAFAEVPHHTHACQGCGFVWRPAKVNTHGVRFLPGYSNAAMKQEQGND